MIREREVRLSSTGVATAPETAAVAPERDERVVYPEIGVTTDNLMTLYSEIADWALPHVENRPLTLVRIRQPITRQNAVPAQAAFVRHAAHDHQFVPSVVPRIDIRELKKTGPYCYVDSAKALLALVEAGVVEWHAWNAHVDNIERPDRVVFDLDPGRNVTWSMIVSAARRVRSLLETHNLESWVKTTGRNGLHVIVPFRREHDWDAVFKFSRAVAAFSTRATPTAALSVPVKWDELARLGGSDH